MGLSDQTIINADDLGISSEVNDAIFDAFDRNIVSSATLLANGPAIESACAGLLDRPDLTVGVHLNTSEFQPLTSAFEHFRVARPEVDLRTTRGLSPAHVRAIGEEWLAQIAKVRDLGVEPTHLDSHHFDHVNPRLFLVLVRVARTSGIVRVRGMQNLSAQPRNALVGIGKWAHRTAMRGSGLRTTDYMTDATTWLQLTSEGRMPSDGICEVMCHPGHPGYAAETARLLQTATLDKRPIGWAAVP